MADRDPTDLQKEINPNFLPNGLLKYLTLAFPELKDSETICLHYISYGYSNERIAELMGKSVWTIKDYVKSLFGIFDVNSKIDLRMIYSCRLSASLFAYISNINEKK
ncbi:helix-turn-helix transcriptional regulator [Photobacterium damselae]|uniref:helix-turn-helix transcriptional regulator n=1 Tax=Photobacterium damselae TaxID=38293 RepID=UPI001EFE57A4|nr:hypothetical protein [Photobacterium damselae]MCG9780370.1 hypothetical protein [Photobacterium damselae]